MNRWRELAGALCDKKMPTKLNVLLYKTAIMYGNEIWQQTHGQEERFIHNINWEDYVTKNSVKEMAKLGAIALAMRRRYCNGMAIYAEEKEKRT